MPSFVTHIYCKVVDNWGDAGVCWRLSRYLALQSATVTLWIDQPGVLSQLKVTPQVAVECGITVRQWTESESRTSSHTRAHAPDLIITAFGCDLPAPVQAAIAEEHPQQTLWINLEYLSAEPWVETHHGLPSVKADGTRQIYFMPGFTTKTAGLLGPEPQPVNALQLANQLGIQKNHPAQRIASLFAYADAPLSALQNIAEPWQLLVPTAIELSELAALEGHAHIEIKRLPTLSQAEYDALLSVCDLNFVRGEDSWVRAQWAAKPFIWQPYRQAEQLHIAKLDAFLDKVQTYGFNGTNAHSWCKTWREANQAWSRNAPATALTALMNQSQQQWQQFSEPFTVWRNHLARQTELSTGIVEYLNAHQRPQKQQN